MLSTGFSCNVAMYLEHTSTYILEVSIRGNTSLRKLFFRMNPSLNELCMYLSSNAS